MILQPIAHFRSPFTSKFGIPKQSGLVSELRGQIVFEAEFRHPDFLRGLTEFDYIWLIWEFSANPHRANSPVVRPPVLGGNERMGVFATRSPFRPNPLGLSSVRIERIELVTSKGPIIHVLGADLMDGTPIYDIKPYITYADCHTSARCGFVDQRQWPRLDVVIPDSFTGKMSPDELLALRHTLELDPRPHFQDDPEKRYGMPFLGYDIHFCVRNGVVIVDDDLPTS